jgi:hypothetical protein
MWVSTIVAVCLIPISCAEKFPPPMAPNNQSDPEVFFAGTDVSPFGDDDYPDVGNGTEEGLNTTICSDFSGGGDITTICQFWLQGVMLFVVGILGIGGNSVSLDLFDGALALHLNIR